MVCGLWLMRRNLALEQAPVVSLLLLLAIQLAMRLIQLKLLLLLILLLFGRTLGALQGGRCLIS